MPHRVKNNLEIPSILIPNQTVILILIFFMVFTILLLPAPSVEASTVSHILTVESSNPENGVRIDSYNYLGGITSSPHSFSHTITKQDDNSFWNDVQLEAPEYIGDGGLRKKFSHWSGDYESNRRSIRFFINTNMTLIANYIDSPVGNVDLANVLGQPGLIWTTGSQYPWVVDGAVARSGLIPIEFYDYSEIGSTIHGPGILSFKWKASGSSSNDTLTFSYEGGAGSPITREIAGVTGWQDVFVELTEPEHYYGYQSIGWTYFKGTPNSVATGLEAGYLSNVVWTPQDMLLIIESSNPEGGVQIISRSVHGGVTSHPNPFTQEIPYGTNVSLTAPEYHGTGSNLKRFDGWSGDITSSSRTISLFMNNNKRVTANYVNAPEDNYTLSVNSNNPASGVDITSTTGHGGTTEYSYILAPGTSVNLTAPQYHGSGVLRKRFSQWTGAVSSSNRTINLTMNADRSVLAHYVDDPENEDIPLGDAVDAPHLSWSTGGNANWYGQSAITHDGVDAAQSGLIGHSENSWLETTVIGPGSLSFWWKVGSEANYDWLEFYINDTRQDRISGDVDWHQKTYPLSAGTNILHWRYVKDSSHTVAPDCGWVDQVVWTSEGGVNGSIQVNINPEEARTAGAQWQLSSGPDTGWKDSGEVITGLAPDSYTIIFREITGWAKPADITVILDIGEEAVEIGNYTPSAEPTWTNISPTDAQIIATGGEVIAASFEGVGIGLYNGNWELLTPATAVALATDGTILVASVENFGTWLYDGDWHQLTTATAQLLAVDNNMIAASFDDHGIWLYNNGWTNLTPVSAKALDFDNGRLVVSVDGHGIWLYDGDWTNLTAETADIVALDDNKLAASFTGHGIWLYEGDWLNLVPVSARALAFDNGVLAAAVDDFGVWLYDGEWTNIINFTANLLTLDSGRLAASFEGHGVWLYE